MMLEEVFFFLNLSNLSVPDDVYLSVPDGGYSRNASRAH